MFDYNTNRYSRFKQIFRHAWCFCSCLTLICFLEVALDRTAARAEDRSSRGGVFCGGPATKDGHRLSAEISIPPDNGELSPDRQSVTVLIGLGDSLTHGTMDGTNNTLNTLNAYLEKIRCSLGREIPLLLHQPLLDKQGNRLWPFVAPTNLGVDGSDIFSFEGLEYYKRFGALDSFTSPDLLADTLLPRRFKDTYDRVLYPINLLAGGPVSQLDSAIWLLNEELPKAAIDKALIILWLGNNDSSTSALGSGGSNPRFLPLPFDAIKSELKAVVRLLLNFGAERGDISFEPYTEAAIQRNLTELQDFTDQYNHVLDRLITEAASSSVAFDLFLLTLPYYSSVGYLMDSEDLEFYLRKLDPGYTVPTTFKRVAPHGEPIIDPLKGDRISLMTFGMMYALLSTGHSLSEVNRILEVDGQQCDGLVLSEEEQQLIMSRIDDFNIAIKNAAASFGSNVNLVDIGQFLNDALTGETVIEVNGRVLGRKWIRGGGFCLDGVHPGYTGQALVANFILEQLNEALGFNASLYDLSALSSADVYVDQDGDGWASGPRYDASGITELLFLFKDPDDNDTEVQVEMPPNFWEIISDVLLGELINLPPIRAEAERLGVAPPADETASE